jgi:hypothetical protein
MALNKKPRSPQKKPLRSLYVSLTGVEFGYVPKRWVKALTGLFLLAPSWILSVTFFQVIVQSARQENFWNNPTFLYFALSVVTGVFLFYACKPLIWGYVIGHELTHAIWAWLHGGGVYDFKVARSGGHIVTDKTNTWVVLSPYFFPFYTVLWLASCGLALLISGVRVESSALYAGIGLTWAFHMAYTIAMIAKGQPDLEYGGVFFSIVLIYFLNLVLISCLLVVASPAISWSGFFAELFTNTVEFSAHTERVARMLLKI